MSRKDSVDLFKVLNSDTQEYIKTCWTIVEAFDYVRENFDQDIPCIVYDEPFDKDIGIHYWIDTSYLV